MKFILLPILTLLLFTNSVISQESYSPTQLQSFVDIYMEAKNNKSIGSFDKVIIDKLAESGVSYARYREIFQSSLAEEKITLNDNEKVFFDELQVLEDKYKGDLKVKLKEQCKTSSINYESYVEIREKYKSDIKFQKSLKQYFDQYINGKK